MPSVFDVTHYGAVVNDSSNAARAANQSAVALAIALMGPAPLPNPPGFVPGAWPGAKLYFPAGIYYFDDTLVITRSMEICGESTSNGMFWANTALCFPPGKTGLVLQFVLDSTDGGRADGAVVRNIAVRSGGWTVGNTPRKWMRWSPSTAYILGNIVIPAQWSKWGYSFECTTAGTSGTSDVFFPGKNMQEVTSDVVADGTTYAECGGSSVVWTLRHAHGVDIRATSCSIENVYISSFAGNGINVVADATITPGGGGANLFFIKLACIDNVGGHGICCHGNDVNVSAIASPNILDVGGFGMMIDPGLGVKVRDSHVRGPEGGLAYWLDRCSADVIYAEGGCGPIHKGGLARLDNVLAGASAADGYTDDYRRVWSTAATIAAGEAIRPTADNGYYYVAVADGTTHATTEPTWPTRVGATVSDNGIVWIRYGLTSSAAAGLGSGDSGMLLGKEVGRHITVKTAGHQYPVAMRFANGPNPIIWQLDTTNQPSGGHTQEMQYDEGYDSWYQTVDVANQMVWWPGTHARYFRSYLPSFPKGVALGRHSIDGGAFPNAYPRMVSASRAPINGEGNWSIGDITFNNDPSSGSPIGWMCTAAGNPGTWKSMGNLA